MNRFSNDGQYLVQLEPGLYVGLNTTYARRREARCFGSVTEAHEWMRKFQADVSYSVVPKTW